MAAKSLPSPELLRQLLRYEPETGKLFWRERPVAFFKGNSFQSAQHRCNNWNSRWAGVEALTANMHGYRHGAVLGSNYRAHRIIWTMVTGAPPAGEIDHINGARADNRWTNLRDVSGHAEQSKNCKLRRDNTSGVVGLSWNKECRAWAVSIGKRHLGTFKDFGEAVGIRRAAEIEHGYHVNHGKR